jgi:hypothetical protein
MTGLMDGFREWSAPASGVGDNPFKLECSVSGPASPGEVEEAWLDKNLDPQAVDLWAECREALLFNDTEYGQWGLKILSPGRSAEVTASEAAERTSDLQLYDVVLGEFLGDQELLVLAPSEEGDRRVLVALPLDPRNEWYGAGVSLSAFFERYLEAQGNKFWE